MQKILLTKQQKYFIDLIIKREATVQNETNIERLSTLKRYVINNQNMKSTTEVYHHYLDSIKQDNSLPSKKIIKLLGMHEEVINNTSIS